ncbi:D-2-hydroxyacid dehydrogenase [Bacillus tianshenii]|uniref:D-2-hydroxyacid dehydrogenase n=1 Tax=Sutcliffiella tianshenii TaxID=1463404 RepID=UPI001CD62C47|nr:D-2-hydroxyacid dehydrogenase [Bacillus tianshenii]MCA1321058.1 D-2-hydroxyacid dehydrogenase [Bacillus tianshenii]
MLVVSTFIPDQQELVERLKIHFPAVTFSFYENIDLVPSEEWTAAEVLITYGEDLKPHHIHDASALRWIMVTSAGMELMPLKELDERNILVTNAKGIHKIPMAEYTLAMMLQTARNTKRLIASEIEGKWDRNTPISELNGRTLTILGAGSIGGEIARLASAFSMRILGVNSSGRGVPFIDEMYTLNELDIVFPQSDYVVSVLPSTIETRRLLKEKHFSLMKNSAVFINVGRGDLVDEKMMMHALEHGEIAHAVLDVFEVEPLPQDHPFWKMENVTVTPHLSSRTKGYQPRALEIFQHNLQVYLQGGSDYQNIINVKRGY